MIAVTRGREQAESTSMQLHTLITELLPFTELPLAKRLALGLVPVPLQCKSSLRPARGRDLLRLTSLLATSGHRVSLELAEQQPCEYQEADPFWDYEDRNEKERQKEKVRRNKEGTQEASPERPSTLRVETPAAPPAFADVPAAGLPSGASTPSFGASGGSRRDSQWTDKGYFE
ncbi:unnamed protein product [Arctia plantaginis]|uniref:Uncharacterized protein n=1 Tax=Arctia plantaginis TaxID=874455 RepID=A0A8S1B1X5_ARCPL|nr:unnamed protein product [Arctia plantaginis]